MDLAQQFAYLVEVQTVSNPVMMAAIRRLPHCDGTPLRVCKRCQSGIEQRRYVVRNVNPAHRLLHSGGPFLMIAAVAVGLGMLTSQFGNWLAGKPQ